MKQAIFDIIQNEDPKYVESITKCDDMGVLNQKLARARKPGRRAIIAARIENLTYLTL